jgi:hypothetical protein
MVVCGDGFHLGHQEHFRRGRSFQRDVIGMFLRLSCWNCIADACQITNSAPSHASLGTLQGIAQTLSAAGRSFGPFVSGSLFSLSVHVQPKGEALAWGLFGGIALAGWLGTHAIRSEGLESTDDGFEEEEEHSDAEEA